MNPEIFRALMKFAVKQARAITDDQEALEVKCLYKQWEKQIGNNLDEGEFIQHGDRLYRVLQTHIASIEWEPGVGAESLYVVIDKEHEGTDIDPIPWASNMECFEGKYYIENDILYLCIRDSGTALQCTIEDVLGNYFEVAILDTDDENEENVVEAWTQPEPTNPYMLGDIVSHNDKMWISDVDNNVWEPGVYGWTEQV